VCREQRKAPEGGREERAGPWSQILIGELAYGRPVGDGPPEGAEVDHVVSAGGRAVTTIAAP